MILILPFDSVWFSTQSDLEFKDWCTAQWMQIPLEDQTCILCNDPRAWNVGVFIPNAEALPELADKVVLYLLCKEHRKLTDAMIVEIEDRILKERI